MCNDALFKAVIRSLPSWLMSVPSLIWGRALWSAVFESPVQIILMYRKSMLLSPSIPHLGSQSLFSVFMIILQDHTPVSNCSPWFPTDACWFEQSFQCVCRRKLLFAKTAKAFHVAAWLEAQPLVTLHWEGVLFSLVWYASDSPTLLFPVTTDLRVAPRTV